MPQAAPPPDDFQTLMSAPPSSWFVEASPAPQAIEFWQDGKVVALVDLKNGKVQLAPGVTWTAAGKAFWKSVELTFPQLQPRK
jgi:hypothetical protein